MDTGKILKANEKAMAERYKLNNYFRDNKNFLFFVSEIKKILAKNFAAFEQADWAKIKCADLVKEFLQHSDSLYSHVNDTYASGNEFKNIPEKEWNFVCSVSSKLIVYLGWNYDGKK